jgi:hypothetical protein
MKQTANKITPPKICQARVFSVVVPSVMTAKSQPGPKMATAMAGMTRVKIRSH